MMNLYKFYAYCGRMGSLHGLFISTPEKVEEAKGSILYFGEVLGKHSDIVVELHDDKIDLISDNQEKVAWLKELLGETVSGFNPIHVYNDQKDEEELL